MLQVVEQKYYIYQKPIEEVDKLIKMQRWLNQLNEMGFDIIQIHEGIIDKKFVKFVVKNRKFEQ